VTGSRARLLIFGALAALAASPLPALPTRELSGVVRDPRGNPIPGASVTLVFAGSRSSRLTDEAGRFAFEIADADDVRIAAEAGGYRRTERRLVPEQLDQPVELVLVPETVSEEIVVTANRSPTSLAETAASMAVLTSEDLFASAAPSLDDALRQIPGFTLFRRSGSRVANPTAQGVSLRGLGASGASRAVVLDDGVPVNDPFGGWISWGRVPRAALDRVEVLRGGGSELYGSGALGGVVSLVRRDAALPFTLAAEGSYGSRETPEATLFAAAAAGSWSFSFAAEAYRTEGYVLVDEHERGSVDTPAASRHETAELTLERLFPGGRAFLRASVFDEARDNGTPLQENDTRIEQTSLGGEWQGRAGSLSLRAWATDQKFHQSFSAVAADRESETLTRLQEVPAEATGASLQWSKGMASHLLVAGVEGRRVSGESQERIFAGDSPSFAGAGGREETLSVFLQDIVAAGERLTVTAALRADRWRNEEGRDSSGIALRDREESAVSPRLSLLYRVGRSLSVTGSAYRAFRAPTLNELYRSFRVGNVETLANENLRAERLSGAEAGAIWSAPGGRLFGRGVLFWMEIERAVGNVTLASGSGSIIRQRQNLGRVRSRGIEAEAEAPVSRFLHLAAGYLFTDATVEGSPATPALEGLRVPQVPRHQGTVRVRLAKPEVGRIAVAARWSGDQFEDDQNGLRLASFWTLDAFASRALSPAVEVFLAAENVLDDRYEVGRTPVTTLGPPRLLRLGIRVSLPGNVKR
jgi:outer membrane receptor protein involved in Fe transport